MSPASGWLPDVVADQTIESAWGNDVRNRTITPFTNAAERTQAIPAPIAGMLTYQLDTQTVEIWNGSAWVRTGPTPTTQTWAPTFYGAGAVIGNAAYVARFVREGSWVTGDVLIALGSASVMATDQLAVSLPVPALDITNYEMPIGVAKYWDNAVKYSGNAYIAFGADTSNDRMRLDASTLAFGTTVVDQPVKTDVPFAWSAAPTSRVGVQFRYEGA